jgi:DNA polymerase I-like protein with 3'-5' exonuclease and polymerase domains
VFLVADYDGLELRTLAQVCKSLFGQSKLAEILNQGKDPHLMVAATILGVSYQEALRRNEAQDEEVDRARQTGKVANFGFSGGLGFESLILFAKRAYKIEMTVDEAKQLKIDWMEAFPEMALYFDYVGAKTAKSYENVATIEQLFTKRIRGKIRFTVACNSLFQGLGSDATKNAGWLITKACYLDRESPLYGCRIVNYVHDEFILECDEERAHAGAMALRNLMIDGAVPFLPDVPPTVTKPMVARCWSKKVRQVWKHGGDKQKDYLDTLVPWEYVA